MPCVVLLAFFCKEVLKVQYILLGGALKRLGEQWRVYTAQFLWETKSSLVLLMYFLYSLEVAWDQ